MPCNSAFYPMTMYLLQQPKCGGILTLLSSQCASEQTSLGQHTILAAMG